MKAPADPDTPTVETERLVLRAHRPDDLDAYAGLWADPAVTRFTSGRPLGREEAWIRILRYRGHWQLFGYGFWAIEDKASGRLIGEAGFHDLKRDIAPSFAGTPEAGWMLLPEMHGRGLAGEAVSAFHDWGDRFLGHGSTVCIVHPENAASIRLAAKAGYRQETQTDYHGERTLIFRRPKPGQ